MYYVRLKTYYYLRHCIHKYTKYPWWVFGYHNHFSNWKLDTERFWRELYWLLNIGIDYKRNTRSNTSNFIYLHCTHRDLSDTATLNHARIRSSYGLRNAYTVTGNLTRTTKKFNMEKSLRRPRMQCYRCWSQAVNGLTIKSVVARKDTWYTLLWSLRLISLDKQGIFTMSTMTGQQLPFPFRLHFVRKNETIWFIEMSLTKWEK